MCFYQTGSRCACMDGWWGRSAIWIFKTSIWYFIKGKRCQRKKVWNYQITDSKKSGLYFAIWIWWICIWRRGRAARSWRTIGRELCKLLYFQSQHSGSTVWRWAWQACCQYFKGRFSGKGDCSDKRQKYYCRRRKYTLYYTANS